MEMVRLLINIPKPLKAKLDALKAQGHHSRRLDTASPHATFQSAPDGQKGTVGMMVTIELPDELFKYLADIRREGYTAERLHSRAHPE